MKRVNILILMLVFAITLSAYQATIKRAGVVLREGPGSYYAAVRELQKGTSVDVIANEDNWLKVSALGGEGYIASNALNAVTEMSSSISQLAENKTDMITSPATESAGIKGLAETFSSMYNTEVHELDYLSGFQIDAKKYKKFKKKTYKGVNLKRIRKKVALPPRNSSVTFSKTEQGFGLAVAAHLAGMGLNKDYELNEYINFIGNSIVSASDIPNQRVRFFILKSNQLGAWSCPGGYVFITEGLLSLLNNEAELACVLAHEVAHVSRKHGMSHYEVEESNSGAQDAFGRLDMEIESNFGVNEDTQKLEQELTQETQRYFKMLLEGLLDDFEIEADHLGVIFAVRAGYSPDGFKSMLLKIQSQLKRASNKHFSKGNISSRRLGSIDKTINKIDPPANLLYHSRRYEEMKMKL